MAISMHTHAAEPFVFHQPERGHDNRSIARRSPPHHVTETPGNAYSNVMPIESLMDFSSRHERKAVTHDTLNHRLDWRGSQRSDDSFSAYVDPQVRESTPQRQERLHETQMRQEEETRDLSRDAEMQDRHDDGNASWPSTVIDAGEIYDEEGINSQESISFHASQQQDEDDDELEGDTDVNGEKKRRRRTNKAEANVLASVFAQTQFPDAHTRESLAKRLNMKSKAVSIWFQNRRQAMKKRASRFGGVEGVNGPTVTAATMQVLDVNHVPRYDADPTALGADRLKRWMSLEDIAAAEREQYQQGDTTSASQPVQSMSKGSFDISPSEEQEDVDLSSAPILDLICRRRSQQQLSRMVSMPSLASVILARDDKEGTKKDLRDLLPSLKVNVGQPVLNRSSSTSSLATRQLQGSAEKESNVATLKKVTDDMEQQDDSKCIIKQGKVTFPTILTNEICRKETEMPRKNLEIWQRMQSSSSTSDGVYSSPDSNKENRDSNVSRYQEKANAEEEDEERTLRLIASRRAAKEQAKKEKKLSEEGRRYLEEADARVALQQRKRTSLGSHQMAQAPGRGLPASIAQKKGRNWNRAASDAQVLGKSRLNTMARVPSLDVTAGRDRAKEDNTNQGLRIVIEQRIACRNAQIQDENAAHRTQEIKAPKLSHRTQQQNPTSKTPYGRTPLQAMQNGSLPRSYVPSHSLPTSSILSRYATPLKHHAFAHTPARYDVSRESNARLNGQEATSLPSSQEGSENGSDEWLEAWAKERRRETQIASTPNAKILSERSAGLLNSAASKYKSPGSNKRPARGVLQPTPRHNDSGFYGSDSEAEDGYGATYSDSRRVSKRRLVSQNENSSSPIKKGDERDRLAAETLLGLGSRA